MTFQSISSRIHYSEFEKMSITFLINYSCSRPSETEMYRLIQFQLLNPEKHPPIQVRNACMILHNQPHKDGHTSGRHFCRPPTDGAINLWAWTQSFSIWQRQQQQQQQQLFQSHTLLRCLLSLMCEACSNIRLHKHRCQLLKGWEQQNNNASLWEQLRQTRMVLRDMTKNLCEAFHDSAVIMPIVLVFLVPNHAFLLQCSFNKLANMNLINCEAGCSCWDKNHLGVTSKGAKYIILVEKTKKDELWIINDQNNGKKLHFLHDDIYVWCCRGINWS